MTVADLFEVVATGDRVKSLERIRDNLASTLEVSPPQYVAALSKQLAETMRELEQLNPPKRKSAVDELAAKRADRRKGAAVSKRAGDGDERGARGGRADGGGGPSV